MPCSMEGFSRGSICGWGRGGIQLENYCTQSFPKIPCQNIVVVL
uniref:Uncharacterized protein n=1 Tax=Arundo donax TaxID=35708 RepID=A0A0A9FFR2_ARUDO